MGSNSLLGADACPGFYVTLFCVSVDLEATKNLSKILRIFSNVSSEPEQDRGSN